MAAKERRERERAGRFIRNAGKQEFLQKETKVRLQLAFESAVENGGEEGVEFGGGFGLQALPITSRRNSCCRCA